nr:MAG TPA: hypothetical protein [Caudoviricetes sp.]
MRAVNKSVKFIEQNLCNSLDRPCVLVYYVCAAG